MSKKTTYEELLQRVGVLEKKIDKHEKTILEYQKDELQFQAIFDQSFQFSLILSLEGVVLKMNGLCRRVCGDLADNVIGFPFKDAGWWKDFADVQEKTTLSKKKGSGK